MTLVFTEGAGFGDTETELVVVARATQVGNEAAQLALAEVGVDVAFVERGEMLVGDHVTTDERAAAAAFVRVGEDRLDGPARIVGAAIFVFVGGESLECVPAEVGALRRGDGGVVDLLEAVLADVADHEPRVSRVRHPVEGETEGIAQAGAVDRRLGVGLARVDPEQLAERAMGILRIVGRIAARAAVARAEIEEVAEELELATIVVRVDRVGYLHDCATGVPRGSRRAPAFELVDPDVALRIGLVDVETAAALVVRRKGD